MALAAADIGVSLRNGAQASHHVADVCLAAPGMRPLERFLEGSRTTVCAIRINLAISVAYNALGGVIAFAGLLNPLMAAILMPLSGLTVLAAFVWATSSDQFEDLDTPRAAPSSMKTQCHAVTRPTNENLQFPIMGNFVR
jgi:cbb3-type cytochrome oxidase maturation protein